MAQGASSNDGKSGTTAKSSETSRRIDLAPRDTRTADQKINDARMNEASRTAQRLEQERQREQMRDTRHDYRYRIDPNTSAGPQFDPPGVNIRRTTP